MLDHLDDLDADFLAFYGIDLRSPDHGLDGPAFFARAFRCWNFRGAMRDQVNAEAENNRDTRPASTPASSAPVQADTGETWVSPDQMKSLFPDLF